MSSRRSRATAGTRGIRLVSDEIYHGIVYGMTAATALSSSDEAFVVNSFSKYFSMTGWRLGWMVAPPDTLRAVECLAQNLFISPPALSQHAALAAFGCRDELDANVARYARNRALLLDELPQAGLRRISRPPMARFISMPMSAHLTNDSAGILSPHAARDRCRVHARHRFRSGARQRDASPVLRRGDRDDGGSGASPQGLAPLRSRPQESITRRHQPRFGLAGGLPPSGAGELADGGSAGRDGSAA